MDPFDTAAAWWLQPLREANYKPELLPPELRGRVIAAARRLGIALGPGRVTLADGRER